MRYESIPPQRILAIDPITSGFGFVVLEPESVRLVDWGTTYCRRTADSLGTVTRSMLKRYHPTQLVLEDPDTSRSYPRRRALGDAVALIASTADGLCQLSLITRGSVRAALATLGISNKRQAIRLFVERFPELAPRVPPPRFVWQSEDPRWAIFDALALALSATQVPSERAASD